MRCPHSRFCSHGNLTRLVLGIVVAWMCVGARVSRAGDDIEVLARLGRLPSWVEAVVYVGDVVGLLESPTGSMIAEDLRESLMLARTQEAWGNLSRVLGWPSEAAFERLLGGRMMLVGVGLESPASAEWVIVSDVTLETERHLHKSLRPAARGAIAAQTVLAIEDGDVELAIVRAKVAVGVAQGTGGQARRVSTIVLNRGGRSPLFTAVVEGLAGRSGAMTLSESRAFAGVQEMGVGDAVVILQDSARRDGAPRMRYLAVSATRTANGFKAGLRASPDVFGVRDRLEPARQAWSDAPLRRLTPDALMLVMGVGSDAVGGVGEFVGVPEADAVVGEPLRRLMSRRWLVALHDWNAVDEGPCRLAFTLGMETPSVRKFSEEADAVMGRVVEAINGEGDNARRRAGPDFEGFRPLATRKATLRGSLTGMWEPAFGPQPLLAWVGRACDGQDVNTAEDSCGWWVATVNPSQGCPPRAVVEARGPADWTGFVADVLADPGKGELKPRVSLGYAAAARLARWVARVQGDPTGVLVAVRSIESVMWEAWLGDDETAQGRVVVTVQRRGE